MPRSGTLEQPPQPHKDDASNKATDMPESIDRKFLGWVLGIGGSLATAGVVALVSMGQSLAVMQANQTSMKETIGEIRAELATGTQSRFTSIQASAEFASRDRRIDTNTELLSKLTQTVADLGIRVNTLETKSQMWPDRKSP